MPEFLKVAKTDLIGDEAVVPDARGAAARAALPEEAR